ncbi:hypothetical protein JG687_00012401 [Phytophthora cactorum]|uniref:Uncharacterized protein n=1 Tax=Phytophthora cactorum TaxID=29920 RepID=A0A8T1U216_9STRA|nr:hypothetical protein PC120_g6383 [Phytophthora cactorum]KAG3072216.1 hypothetical protein PC121_g9027 [Phytophthora cactorum]KAG6953454.1 hypothetical protein JG687_00012401 [Phytophthora cactorum]
MQPHHVLSQKSLLTSYVTSYVRSASRSVPRHYKSAYLLQRWYKARQAGLFLEEAVILAEFAGKPPPHPRVRALFNFNALSDSTCKKRFRFDKSELCVLVQLMGISEVVTRERTRATAIEALCVVLYKLPVPVRWEDMEFFFGRSASGLSNI